ncbi:hypothetical protein ACIP5Y_01795 [Nocardia sp. NPDC088792]|uniref:carboxymuconolactone decarboxylase family protein n=1 Tax=Nocardia sp. NPDC088792 TaxID=3364332 RepID=UPI0037FB5CD6
MIERQHGGGLGWPRPGVPRLRPRLSWLRFVFPGVVQVVWIGAAHPRLLSTLFALEGPAEFGQALVATLGHRDIELVVLRTTWNAGHYYHYSVHALWARIRERGEFLAAVQAGPRHPRWSPRQAELLRATDELHDNLVIGDLTLQRLRRLGYSDRELIEICFITAHYELIGMLEESAGMPPEPLLGRPPVQDGPRRPRTGKRAPHPILDARTPWTPGGDEILALHRPLHTLLGWYGRRMARISTLDAAEIGAALDGSIAEGARATVVGRAVTELDREFFLSDETWADLLRHYTVREVMELCVLVGHYRTYEMIVDTMRPGG